MVSVSERFAVICPRLTLGDCLFSSRQRDARQDAGTATRLILIDCYPDFVYIIKKPFTLLYI